MTDGPETWDGLEPTGRYSSARVFDAWYAACRGDELLETPIARTILDLPLVLYRASSCSRSAFPSQQIRVSDLGVACSRHAGRASIHRLGRGYSSSSISHGRVNSPVIFA